MQQNLEHYWKNLPPVIKMGLLQGSLGKQHCLGLASAAMSAVKNPASQQQELILAQQLLLAAWEHSPLNGELANNLLKLCQAHLPQDFKTLLQCIGLAWQAPAKLSSLASLLQKDDFEQSLAYLTKKMQAEPGNLFWLEQIWNLAFFENRLELLNTLLAGLAHELEPLKHYLLAFTALAAYANALQAKDQEVAAQCLQAASSHLNKISQQIALQTKTPLFAWLAPLELKGHSLHLQGQTAEAVAVWQNILNIRPWHTSLALHLYSQLKHKPSAAVPEGKMALLLYSFNKAKDLNATIAALAPEAELFAGIHIVNNGSQDETATMLKAWQERLGKQRLNIISLPVNVGAAAARNWLRDLPGIANTDFCIYLDDDALVDFASLPAVAGKAPVTSPGSAGSPASSWLSHFAASLAAYPQASAYGLKIIDHQTPYLAQSVDLHLTPPQNPNLTPEYWANLVSSSELPQPEIMPPTAFSLNQVHSQSFGLANLAEQAVDFGGFSYLRPCLSVTGCCHLFHTRDLLEGGGFNLSFSPSQFDDLERDLRQAAQGRYACYNGMGQVSHLQRTGRGRQMSRAQYGSGLANRFKLSAHFTDHKLVNMLRFQFELLENDLLQKLIKLDALNSF